jgi:hypothetical protein
MQNLVGTPDAPHRVVSMCEFQNRLFVATEGRVYELIDGVLHPLMFVNGQQPADSTSRP